MVRTNKRSRNDKIYHDSKLKTDAETSEHSRPLGTNQLPSLEDKKQNTDTAASQRDSNRKQTSGGKLHDQLIRRETRAVRT